MRTVDLSVSGMTCDHCVGTVRKALEAVPGVSSATVDLKGGRAEVAVQGDGPGVARLREAATPEAREDALALLSATLGFKDRYFAAATLHWPNTT